MAPLTDKGVIKLARFSIETCDGSPVAYVISSSIIVGYHKRLWPHSVTEREIPAIAEVAAGSRAKKSQVTVAAAQRNEADPGLLQYHEQLPSLSWHVGEIRGPRSSLLPN